MVPRLGRGYLGVWDPSKSWRCGAAAARLSEEREREAHFARSPNFGRHTRI